MTMIIYSFYEAYKNQLFMIAKRALIVSIMALSNYSFLSIASFFFIFLYFKSSS
jgi:hypothetical protein